MIEGSCHCGRVSWRFQGVPATATICNCSLCRRYGALWAYGTEGEAIALCGPTEAYVWNRGWLGFHFCSHCACLAWWRAVAPDPAGRFRVGLNLRLAPPDAVTAIPLIRHDTETKADLPPDGRCVGDVWF